jgi:hypothetical protein
LNELAGGSYHRGKFSIPALLGLDSHPWWSHFSPSTLALSSSAYLAACAAWLIAFAVIIRSRAKQTVQ